MKRYVVRTNESFLFESFERSFISVVLGPRRVGKTTLIDHYMRINPERLWVEFEHGCSRSEGEGFVGRACAHD